MLFYFSLFCWPSSRPNRWFDVAFAVCEVLTQIDDLILLLLRLLFAMFVGRCCSLLLYIRSYVVCFLKAEIETKHES